MNNRLKLVLPKGRIFDNVLALLSDAGLGIRVDERTYVPDLAGYLVDRGVLVRVQPDLLVHAEAVAALREGLRELFAGSEVLAVADVGKRFGISRKYSVPLLEYCDRRGWTVRREAERRRGPDL